MINPVKYEKIQPKMDEIIESILKDGKNRSRAIYNAINYMFLDNDKIEKNIKEETAYLLKNDKKFLEESNITLALSEFTDFIDSYSQLIEHCNITPGDILYCIESQIPRRYEVIEYEIDSILMNKNGINYCLHSIKDNTKTKMITQNDFYKSVFFYMNDANKAISDVEKLEKLISDNK